MLFVSYFGISGLHYFLFLAIPALIFIVFYIGLRIKHGEKIEHMRIYRFASGVLIAYVFIFFVYLFFLLRFKLSLY